MMKSGRQRNQVQETIRRACTDVNADISDHESVGLRVLGHHLADVRSEEVDSFSCVDRWRNIDSATKIPSVGNVSGVGCIGDDRRLDSSSGGNSLVRFWNENLFVQQVGTSLAECG